MSQGPHSRWTHLGFKVPQAPGAVEAGRAQQLAPWVEGHAPQALRVPLQLGQLLHGAAFLLDAYSPLGD